MGFGSGYSAPIISAVDPAGEFGPINTTDIQDTILALSRLRSVKQTVNPMEACHRSWLLTVTNSTPLPSGELPRETYPDGTDAAGNAVREVPIDGFPTNAPQIPPVPKLPVVAQESA